MLEAQEYTLVIQSEGRGERIAEKTEVKSKLWMEESLEEKILAALEKPQLIPGKREFTPRVFTEIDESNGITCDSRR